MLILDNHQILKKIDRIALEIIERNDEANQVFLLGINSKGFLLANLLTDVINQRKWTACTARALQLRINPANPLDPPVELLGIDVKELANQIVILVDDVANTGRTLFYGFQCIMSIIPAKVEVCVMVDRKHKLFPVHVDYVGMALATTLMENIEVTLSGELKAELS